MDRHEALTLILKKHGYRSVNQFCVDNKIPQTNMSKRLRGTQKVELPLLFSWATMLHEPVDTLIEIFYPEEMEANRNSIE